MLFISRRPLSFRQPLVPFEVSHHLIKMPSGIEVRSSAYGTVTFVLLMYMKLIGPMKSSASLYVMSRLPFP